MVWLIHAIIRSSPWYVGNARSRRSPPTKGGGSQTGAYLSEPIARGHNDSDRAGSHTPPPPVTLHRPPNAACRPGDCFGLEVRNDDQQSTISSQSNILIWRQAFARNACGLTNRPKDSRDTMFAARQRRAPPKWAARQAASQSPRRDAQPVPSRPAWPNSTRP